MQETPFFFRSGGRSLFAILHAPDAPASGAFVFCHALAEEKLWTHRAITTFARQLAERGVAVLRFDHMGNGDSEGHFEDSSVESMRTDVGAAIEELRRRTGVARTGLLGLRFGATVASLAAEEPAIASAVDRLVLWAPIVDGARYMQELLRINLTTQLAAYKEVRDDREALAAIMKSGRTVNIDGYELADALFSQASAVKLAAAPKQFAGPCLVVHVDRAPDRPAPEPQQLAGCYARATLKAVQEEPFWKEIPRFYQDAPNLAAATLEWLDATHA